MTEKEKWRKMFREQRLQHQLELQSQQIERVFSHHKVPAQVAGGQVNSRLISFDLYSQLEAGWERLRNLKQDLLMALGVSDVRLERENDRWRLHIDRPEAPPVSLLDLLPVLAELPPVTATLGVAEDGRPLLLEFSDPELTHVLLSGDHDAGKTALLRTLALSLAVTNKQSQLQMVILEPDTLAGETSIELEPLTYLPHMLAPVAHSLDDVGELLASLVDEVSYRLEQEIKMPTIIVLIDHFMTLIRSDDQSLSDSITQLVQQGAPAGVYVIASTRAPESATLGNLQRANLPIRIVGKISDAQHATAATGAPDAHAEYLLGKGDFLAIVDGSVTHFQAAYVGDYDLHLLLDMLHRNRPRPLLARPISSRHIIHVDETDNGKEATYQWEDEEGELNEIENESSDGE